MGNDTYIRNRAARFGLGLSDEALNAIKDKWLSDPLCALDDLFSGIQRLSHVKIDPNIFRTKLNDHDRATQA